MTPQRIAIASSDGRTVCDHLARATTYLIFEIENGAVSAPSVRTRGNGECGSHKSFVEMVDGCSTVICGGIGQGAVDALVAHGVTPLVASETPLAVEDALSRHLSGTLATTNQRVCLCSH